MELPIQRIEADRTALQPKSRLNSRRDGQPVFTVEPDADRARQGDREGRQSSEQPPPAVDLSVAPRGEDEAGTHLDVTA